MQCSGEVNIYLHNLILLSDCLIFPCDFPLLFDSTPKLSFKTSSTKKDRTSPRGLGPQWSWWCNVCSPLCLGAPWICSASCLTALLPCCITYKSPSSTCRGYLHLIPSDQDSFPTPPQPTPPPHFAFIVIIAIIILSTSTALCGFSSGRH